MALGFLSQLKRVGAFHATEDAVIRDIPYTVGGRQGADKEL